MEASTGSYSETATATSDIYVMTFSLEMSPADHQLLTCGQMGTDHGATGPGDHVGPLSSG